MREYFISIYDYLMQGNNKSQQMPFVSLPQLPSPPAKERQ